ANRHLFGFDRNRVRFEPESLFAIAGMRRCRRGGRPEPPTSTVLSRRSGGAGRVSGPWGPRWPSPRGGGRTRSRLGRRSTPSCAWHFFYARPILCDPGGDGLVVALERTSCWPLAGPAEPLAQYPPGP